MFFKLHNTWVEYFLPFQSLKIVRPHSRRVASGGKLGRSWSLCALLLGVGAGSQIYERMEKEENRAPRAQIQSWKQRMGETREERRTAASLLNWVQNFISKWKQNNKTKLNKKRRMPSDDEDTCENTYGEHISPHFMMDCRNVPLFCSFMAENKLLIWSHSLILKPHGQWCTPRTLPSN